MPQCFLHDFPYICMATMQYAPTIPRLCYASTVSSILLAFLGLFCPNYASIMPQLCFFRQVAELPVKALSRVEDGFFCLEFVFTGLVCCRPSAAVIVYFFYLTFILLRVIPTALMCQPQRAWAQVQFAISLVWVILQVRKNRFQSKRKMSIFQFHVNKRIITKVYITKVYILK